MPAAAPAITMPAAIAALVMLMCRCGTRRRSRTWCTVLACTAGGPPEGHSAASSSAASASPDRPRCSQSGPYACPAAVRSPATSAAPSAGRRAGSLASPASTSGRSGPGTGSSGTGSS